MPKKLRGRRHHSRVSTLGPHGNVLEAPVEMNEGGSRVMLSTMQLLLRAIITGFGYKIGAELGRYVATKVGLVGRDKAEKEEAEEELPEGIPINPPDDGDDVEADRDRSDD